jgi:hypothetical protein
MKSFNGSPSPRRAAPLSARRSLPGAPIALVRIAERLALHARPVLNANKAILLNATITGRGDNAVLTTSAWDAHFLPAALALISPGDPLGYSLAALEDAARVLLAELARRWPVNALPPALGIFTDGGGVAFSSDNPSPLSPDWLARHQSGLCPTTTLLPFAANSLWAHLVAPPASEVLH